MLAGLSTQSYVFIGVIAVYFLVALVQTARDPGGRAEAAAPSILTSLGILGTFIGILIGLMAFDYTKIDQSLPGLLKGLQFSFVTSVVGLVASIAFRMIAPLYGKEGDETATDAQRSAEELLAEQLQLQRQATASAARTAESLEQVRSSISGDGESSVATQLMKVRETIRDTSESQRKDFQAFAEKVSELGSKQLIKALEEVIRDFNTKLSEQFGENFRRLDESVAKLLQWQDQYRQQMIDLKDAFQVARDGIQETRDRLAEIRTEAEAIPGLLATMKGHFEKLDVQLNGMEHHLVALVEMRNQATTAIPELKDQITEIFNVVESGNSEASKQFTELVTRSGERFDAFSRSAEELHGRFVETVDQQISRIGAELSNTSDTFAEGQTKMLTGFHEGQSKMLTTFDESQKAAAQGFTDTLRQINENAERSSDQIRVAAEKVQSHAEQASSSWKEAAERASENSAAVRTEFENTLKSTATALEKANQDLGSSLEQQVADQAERIRGLGDELRKEANEAAKQREETLNESMRAFDSAMQQEVQRIVTGMGQHLGGVTEKFATDYGSLTDKMSRVVRQAEKLSN